MIISSVWFVCGLISIGICAYTEGELKLKDILGFLLLGTLGLFIGICMIISYNSDVVVWRKKK
jgi:uncharacterized YccA/Bax inhibitor family protein